MRTRPEFVRRTVVALALTTMTGSAAASNLSLGDFNSLVPGSFNPRDGWFAFGAGTTDRGVRADGSVGSGAFHTVDWDETTWGVGQITTGPVDLSGFNGVRVDARLVPLSEYLGTTALEFALDMPDGTEFATPGQTLSSGYQTFTFNFSDLERTAGSGTLNLQAGKPKLIVRKGGQAGVARFDFDEITAFNDDSGDGGDGALMPVALYPPWDGDRVRAMWLYAAPGNLIVDSVAESQRVLDFCAREGINRICFGAYRIWALGSAEQQDQLRTFLAAAHASGIRVAALLDGIDWHENPALVRSRIDQILAINEATPDDTRDDFQAIHFDIEFWLDDSWDGDETRRQQVARQFLDNVLVNARNWLDASGAAMLATGVDLSTHFDAAGMLPSVFDFNGQTKYFLEHVFDHTDDVVLMSYYDSVNALATTTLFELDLAAAHGRTLQLGANVQPDELPINTFADNLPTPYASMTRVLQDFHANLSPARLAALDGFCVFYYDQYVALAPPIRRTGDLDGDEDVDPEDLELFLRYLTGPGIPVSGLSRDADFDRNGTVDLEDLADFGRAFTGRFTPAGPND